MASRNKHRYLVGLAIISFSLAIFTGATLLSTVTWAGSPNRVGLVVRFGDGSLFTHCVEFDENQISGLEVLLKAGLNIIYESSGPEGAAVCKIENEGCDYPAEDCFCQCPGGPNCIYWSYWHLKGGAWEYSQVGASGYYVSDGDVEGWSWAVELSQGIAFDDICTSLLTATSTNTTNPTSTPTATHTPPPTATPTSTQVPPTPAVGFSVQPETIVAGGCAQLRWDVEDVQEVYLDGQPQQGHGSKQACPTQTQTYELRIVSAAGEFRHQVTVKVVQPSPTIIPSDMHTPLPVAASAPTDTPGPQPEVPSPTPTSLPTETLPLTVTLLPTDTATPTASPPAVAMVAPPPTPSEKETDVLSEVEQSTEIPSTKVTMLNWLLFLAAAVVGTLGFGGMAFVGILALLGVIYLFARWSQGRGGDYGYWEENDTDSYS